MEDWSEVLEAYEAMENPIKLRDWAFHQAWGVAVDDVVNPGIAALFRAGKLVDFRVSQAAVDRLSASSLQNAINAVLINAWGSFIDNMLELESQHDPSEAPALLGEV